MTFSVEDQDITEDNLRYKKAIQNLTRGDAKGISLHQNNIVVMLGASDSFRFRPLLTGPKDLKNMRKLRMVYIATDEILSNMTP